MANTMSDDERWAHEHPTAARCWATGINHAEHGRRALTKIEFLDAFELDRRDYREGFSASQLYNLYRDARHQTSNATWWSKYL